MKTRRVTLGIIITIFFQFDLLRMVNSNCGIRFPPRSPLITKGFISNEYWPWHAAIYYVENQQNAKYRCGGTLFNSNLILTAAHCVCNYDVAIKSEKVLVSLGRQNLNVSERNIQSFNVSHVIPHPDYSSIDLKNDIAIIKLLTEATFNNYVQPICLWDSSKSELSEVIGRLGTVIGWGNTETDNPSDTLQQAFMPVVSSLTCLVSNSNFFGSYLSETNFCAGFRNGTSVCNGDSGGSMTFEDSGTYYIRGIASVSPARLDESGKPEPFCDVKQYAIFTDVAQYLPWIDQMITVKCEKAVNCWFDTERMTYSECNINITFSLAFAKRNCKIIFDEVSNSNISILTVWGELRAIPDISDAFTKFKNLTDINFGLTRIDIVEKKRLLKLRTIKYLSLFQTGMDNPAAHTFDDLKDIEELNLGNNGLNEIHKDLFKELYKLRVIHLDHNGFEVLPEGLFRNNLELEVIWAQHNLLTVILIDFENLPKVSIIDLLDNICINEFCNVDYMTCKEAIIRNIRNKCKA